MHTEWHSRWHHPQNAQTYAARFTCRLYHLRLRERHPLSRLLRRLLPAEPPDSAHAVLRAQYARHQYPIEPKAARDVKGQRPQPELPELHQHATYHLLALNGHELERTVRASGVAPDFALHALLQQFCERYRCKKLEHCFPALHQDISSSQAETRRIVTKSARALPAVAEEDDALRYTGRSARTQPRAPVCHDRLVPLALLPLLLDLMPLCYQRCNNIVEQCLRLRSDLLMQHRLTAYPGYVTQQLQQLRHNCQALGFLQQQARFELHARQAQDEALERAHAEEVALLRRQLENLHEAMRFLYDRQQQQRNEAKEGGDEGAAGALQQH